MTVCAATHTRAGGAGPEIEVREGTGEELLSGESAVAFGSVATSGLKTVNFAVKNTGDAPLIGLLAVVDGANGADFVVTQPANAELAPGGSASVGVTFIPQREGEHVARLRILSSDADESNFRIDLTATGAPREVAVRIEEVGGGQVFSNGPAFDFGSAEIGKSLARTFKITNLAEVELVQVYTDSYPLAGFTVTPVPSSIAAGGSAEFTVRWSPYSEGEKTQTIQILANNLENAPFRFVVKAQGTSPSPLLPALPGLHFRMGERNVVSIGQPITGSVHDQYPWDGGLTLLLRWRYDPAMLTTIASETGSAVTQSLVSVPISTVRASYIGEDSFVRGDVNTPPTWAGVSGAGSAKSVTNSLSAVRFENGSYLKNVLRMLPDNDDLGMELWVKPESATGRQCIAYVGDGWAPGGFGLFLIDGVLYGRVNTDEFAATAPLSLNEWHHVALVVNDNTASLYVDGVAAGVLANAGLPSLVKGMGVGATVTGGDPFTGTVDEIRMFETEADGFVPERDLLLKARPHAVVDIPALEFDSTIIGAPTQQRFSLSNTGRGWLVVQGAEFIGEGAANFEIGSVNDLLLSSVTQLVSGTAPFAGPRGVGPNRRLLFAVKYNPSTTGPSTATLRLTTNDPENPVFDIALSGSAEAARPEIVVQPNPIDWGTVVADNVAWAGLSITNRGSLPVTGLTIRAVGPHAADIAVENSYPTSLQPGESLSHMFAIRPQAAGARLAALVIGHDGDADAVEVPVFGRAVPRVPEISVRAVFGNYLNGEDLETGATINLGPVMQGKSGACQIAVQNLGWAQLQAGLSIEGPNAADFTFSEMRPMEPQVIGYTGTPPYTVVTAFVSFKPSAVGTRTAVLRIQNNDADENPFEIHLTGTGTTPVPVMQVEDRGYVMETVGGFIRCGTGVINGAPATASWQIRNEGALPLTNFQAAFSGAGAAAFSATISPASIAPGAVGNLVVTFAPESIGPHEAVLSLTSNGAANPFEVAVGGTGAYGSRANLAPELPEGWVGTAMAQLPNGNVLMAGYVPPPETEPNPQFKLREIRVDGTQTGRFDRFTIYRPIRAMTVDSAGRILIAGDFDFFAFRADPPRASLHGGRIIRILSDGSLDESFAPASGQAFSGRAIVALPNGKILVGGDGVLGGRANLIRLNEDGSVDDTFTLAEPNAVVNALALQEDGKVLVGGDFTNYGQQRYQDPTAILTLSFGEISLSGLFRLTASGEVDSGFGNPGYQKVSTLAIRGNRIAVGGMEKVWYTPEVGGGWYVPVPSLEDWNTARLIDLNGHTLAREKLHALPTAVALQPGDRMLVAPGNDESYPVKLRPAVALLQGGNQAPQMYGLRAVHRSDGPPLVAGEHGFANVRQQRLEGPINALLSQADGKVLVAGGLTKAEVFSRSAFVYMDSGSELTWGGLPLDERPLPAETALTGFAQLDVDGFYYPAVPVRDHSDGLRVISLSTEEPTELFVPLGGSATATVDGPHAADFIVEKQHALSGSSAVIGSNEPPVTIGEEGAYFSIQFQPSGVGLRRAVLRLSDPAFENTFEVALEGTAESALPEGLVIVDSQSGAVLRYKQDSDFGTVVVGQSKSRNFLLRNDGATAVTSPVQVSVADDASSSFTLLAPAINSLEVGASVPLTVTFKPQAGGDQTAALRVTMGDGLPFDIDLKGSAAAVPTLATVPPKNLIAEVGGPLTLQLAPVFPEQATCKWMRNGRVIPGATDLVLHISQAKLTDAGSYTAEIKTLAGKLTTPATKVSVINAPERRVVCGKVKPLVLSIDAAGDGLTYEWKKNGMALPKSARITGAKGKTLTVRNVLPGDEGAYTCHVKAGTAQRAGGESEVAYAAMPGLTSVTGYAWQVAREVDETLEAQGEGGVWTISGVPTGVKVDPGTGRLTGKPTRSGDFSLRATLTHPSGTTSMIVPVTIAPLDTSLTGSFTALVDRDPAVLQGLGALVTLTTSTQGSLSGMLTYCTPTSLRKMTPFVGTLAMTGEGTAQANVTINPTGTEPITLTMEFAGSDVTLKMNHVTVGMGGPKAPLQGDITMRNFALLPVTEDAELLPTGFARMNLRPDSAAAFYGKVATTRGMRAFTLTSAQLKMSGEVKNIPIYAVLAPGETVSGWLTPQNADPLAEQGTLSWNVPAAGGEEVEFTLVGGKWTMPAAGESLLGVDGQDNTLILKLGADHSQELLLTAANRLTPVTGGTVWPQPSQGGLVSRIGAMPPMGTFSGMTWAPYQGGVLPLGSVDGVFVPGLDRAVGIYVKTSPASVGGTLALPVTLEVKPAE